jgi:toxin ParE1/3/4
MTRIVFLAPAEEEMLEAAQYYEGQTRGLGHEFLVEVQRTVARIIENPRLGQIVRRGIRRRLMPKFLLAFYIVLPHKRLSSSR